MPDEVESWEVRLTGGLQFDRNDMRVRINAVPLEWQIITEMELLDYTFEWSCGAVVLKRKIFSEGLLEAVLTVRKQETPAGIAQAAEELESVIHTEAFGRLLLLRNNLYGVPEAIEESVGATKMLLTLDALGAIDVGIINALLSGKPDAPIDPWKNADYSEDEDEGQHYV